MLSQDITRYVDLHRAMGFKFKQQAGMLRHFARFAECRAETRVLTKTVLAWASEAPSDPQRRLRLSVVRRFALHMQAETDRHEVPPSRVFGRIKRERRMPHIYSPDEVRRLLLGAAELTPKGSIRPLTYVTLFALIASTGLRISEALGLDIKDITSEGLVVRHTKFRKSRLLPLHPTTRCELSRYLAARQRITSLDSSVFISLKGSGLTYSTAYKVFLEVMRSVSLRGAAGDKGPCLHDLRHTFAVRSLESCGTSDREVARHMLALSTYLGHAHPSDTFWYLQATPKLMAGIASAGEAMFSGGSV